MSDDEPPFLQNPDAKDLIAGAAAACRDSYEKPKPGTAFRKVNLYWLRNPIAAQVSFTPFPGGGRRYWVAFRGTILQETGNWIFANLQAYKTKYAGYPLDGQVHMGFYRAFHWLWSNSNKEPAVDKEHEKMRDEMAIRRRLTGAVALGMLYLVFLPVVLFLVFLLRDEPFSRIEDRTQFGWTAVWTAAGMAGAYLLIVLFEIGEAERWFTWKKPKTCGKALEEVLLSAVPGDEVVFTGHSLGGAMAVHAFIKFRQSRPKVKSLLVTFAAPRAGDEDWVEAFGEKKKPEDYIHIVNRGDPVPQVPGTFEQAVNLDKNAGYLRSVLVIVGILRRVWAFIYRQTPPGAWPRLVVYRLGSHPLRVMKHPMAEYITEVKHALKIKIP